MGRRLIVVVSSILMTLMFIAAGQEFLPRLAPEKSAVLLLTITFIVAFIHEIGHAVAASAFGGKVRAISVWGVGYDFDNGRFGIQRHLVKRDVGGYVLYTFNNGPRNPYAYAWVAAAGPLANILTSVIAAGFSGSDSILSGCVSMLAIISAGLAVVNLMPFSGSDGSTIWAAIRRSFHRR